MSLWKMVSHIFIGNFKRLFKIYDKESIRRYKICKRCEHRKYMKHYGYYCDECGCPIRSKITVKDERCFNDKW